MSSSTYNPEPSTDEVFGQGKRLADVVAVQYRTNHLRRSADARQLHLSPGDQVVVDARYGPVVAEVVGPVQRRLVDDDELALVLRKATDDDLQRAEDNETLERRAHRFALECVRDHDLNMNLVRTHCIEDGSRIVFYFTADSRIDFRALVRDLAAEFRTRIEMRQIGVRDGAQLVGGIGPCGRELCCSTFLEHFEPISVRMARNQGLTVNPSRITGMCGRLMCCMVYEQKVYRRLKQSIPRSGQQVRIESGTAHIRDVDVVNRRVTVDTTDDRRLTLSLDDVIPIDNDDESDSSHPAADDDKLWDGEPPRKK